VELLQSAPPRAGPHPLLCFLHGYDEAAPVPPEVALTRHGPLSPTAAKIAAEEFILIVPQLPFAGDIWHRFAHDVKTIVEAASERHGGDAKRAFLTGFSFGANGVFDLAGSGLWRALWPVDPTRPPKVDTGVPTWLSVGQVARSRKAAFMRALPKAVCVDEGDDHVGAARRAYADERIYRWLLEQ